MARRRAASENAEATQRAAEKAAREMHQNPNEVLTDKIIKPGSAGAKVIVACKIGIAFLDLQVFRKVAKMQDTQTGPRKVEEYVREPSIVRVRGTAYPRGTVPPGYPERPEMWHGYALTRGVDKEFWDLYEEQNRNSPYVKNDLLFACENENDVRARALSGRDVKSSIDPITGDTDPRIQRPSNSAIEPLSEMKGPRG